MKEKWKTINDYPDYKISSHGRLMRVNGYKREDNRILGSWMRGSYLFCVLCKENKRKQFSVHRLVFEHFVSGDFSKMINHKDGNKLNNHYKNLEASDAKHNARHYRQSTKQKRGVVWDRTGWKASIRIDKKLIHLGMFKTKKEGYEAYRERYKEHTGVYPW